jgi:DNA-binding MarR family transcriptional regulator
VSEELPTSLLMFIAQRYAEGRIYDGIRAAGFDDFTIAQGRLAMGIDPEGTRLTVLADRAHVAKQTATALVDSLERSGYVERVPDPLDGRARLVRITARGREVIPVARANEQAIEQEWTAYLGPRRMRQLREALELLRIVTDPYMDDGARTPSARNGDRGPRGWQAGYET